jgi:uncharacterized membrane protein YhiD involved in acid resistance
MTLDPTVDILLRFLMATIVGGLIGLNRELMYQAAGLRTHALVMLILVAGGKIELWVLKRHAQRPVECAADECLSGLPH